MLGGWLPHTRDTFQTTSFVTFQCRSCQRRDIGLPSVEHGRNRRAQTCPPVERPAQAERGRLLQRGSTHWLVQPRSQGLRSPALSKAQCRLGTASWFWSSFFCTESFPVSSVASVSGSLLVALSSSPCGCPLSTSVAFVAGSSLCALSSSPGGGHLPFQFHQAPPVLWHGAAPLRFPHVSYHLLQNDYSY